ncbi:MAG: alpha/beta hydrolase [Bacteroidales bacterium]
MKNQIHESDISGKRVINYSVKDGKEIIRVVLEKDSLQDSSPEEYVEGNLTYNISETELIIYPADPQKDKKVAVLIFPGGGFSKESLFFEGEQPARWLASEGITGIVMKYRLPKGRSRLPLSDAQLALIYIKEHATQLGIGSNALGIWGFSCGGHIASAAATHFTSETRPDFQILFYPVISMESGITHEDTRKNLMGDIPTEDEIRFLSNDEQVKRDTPPALIILSDDDNRVTPMNSIRYYSALKKKEIQASLHIFPQGGHGWGFKPEFNYKNEMKTLVLKWIEEEIVQ